MNKTRIAIHAMLLSYSLIALFPFLMIVINSFKAQKDIFDNPLSIPVGSMFSIQGYVEVLTNGEFGQAIINSLLVSVLSTIVVVLTGAMAAWALTEYRFKLRPYIIILFTVGVMVPVRLGTIPILEMMSSFNLVNSVFSLILVYIAQGLPFAIIILSSFISQIPREILDAARCDGIGEYKIFTHIVFPLIKPSVATVTIFITIPIWNDLWFPLILAPGDEAVTLTLATQQFVGQYYTNWSTVLASLAIAVVPLVIMYVVLSRQIIRGISFGAVK